MRLVFLSHDSNCTGGAQKCLLDLLKGIKKIHPDWQVYMIFPNQGDFVDACSCYLDGYKILKMRWWLIGRSRSVTTKQKFSYACKLLKRTISLLRHLRAIKADYAITNTIVLPHLAFAAKLARVKHCWFIHEIPNVTWDNLRFVFEAKTVFRFVDRLSLKVLVPSDYAKRYYEDKMSKDKLHAINQAIELLPILDTNLHESRYTVLLIGAFDSNKGQMELLQAVKSIVDMGRDIQCYLVGADVGCMHRCQEYVRTNCLDENVRIVPFTKQVSLYYSLADVVVVCSALESFGRVAVEAQICGIPVILSNVGANPERIEDGVNGLLYQKGNIVDLSEKIEMLRDATVRKVYSRNIDSSMLSRQYSIDNFALDFCALLG